MADATMKLKIDLEPDSDYRLCPLKESRPPILAFWNVEPSPDLLTTLKLDAIKVKVDGAPPRIEYVGGYCDGPRCAWWDDPRQQCAALTLARSAAKLAGKK